MERSERFVVPEDVAIVGRVIVVERACDAPRLPKRTIERAVAAALDGEAIADARVTVVVCDDETIRAINAQFLDHDWATDVITFPLAEAPLEGEIYISVDTARRQAAEYGVSLRNELVRLAVHGTLHLVGYDDTTEAERLLMHRVQERYVELVLRSARTAKQIRRPRSSAG